LLPCLVLVQLEEGIYGRCNTSISLKNSRNAAASLTKKKEKRKKRRGTGNKNAISQYQTEEREELGTGLCLMSAEMGIVFGVKMQLLGTERK